jgi:hypothetical protein
MGMWKPPKVLYTSVVPLFALTTKLLPLHLSSGATDLTTHR